MLTYLAGIESKVWSKNPYFVHARSNKISCSGIFINTCAYRNNVP